MKAKSIEYWADLLPDGHLSLPEEIKKKLKFMSDKKVKIIVELGTGMEIKENHSAFGIWADRLSEGNSAEIAENLRNKIERRNG